MNVVSRRCLKATTGTVVALLVLFALASLGFAWMFTRSHSQEIGSPPGDFPFPIQDISFETADSLTIRGWYSPSVTGGSTVILLHGYMGNRNHMLGKARMLRQAGYGALLYDARGCGESEGNKISMGYFEVADLLAAMGYLRGRGVKDIALIGVSQGGATIALAAPSLGGVRCVILESTYNNMTDAIDRRFRHYVGVPGWLGASLLVPMAEWRLGCGIEMIAPDASIGKLPCPVSVISGDEDTRVPVEDTYALFQRANPDSARLWMIPGADHEDLQSVVPEKYERRVLGFLKEHMPP